MSEYFKTVDQQIELLKSRGLIINDEQEAKDALLRYNYYKIINATIKYFVNFEKNGNYIFREGTDFQDLLEVHHFDKEIKKVLLAQMLEIERIARSIISYKFVEKYPQKNAYLNAENFNKKERNLVLINIDSIEQTIDTYRQEENYNRSINYYIDKYGSVPFWFVVNFMSFGKLVNFYETLDYELQEDIADEFQKFVEENLGRKLDEFLTPNMLKSFLTNAKDIRNMSAHDNLILGYKYEKIHYFKTIHDEYGIKENDERTGLYETIVVLKYLLPQNTFDIVKNINDLVDELEKNIDEVAFKKVIESLGGLDLR